MRASQRTQRGGHEWTALAVWEAFEKLGRLGVGATGTVTGPPTLGGPDGRHQRDRS